MQESTVVVPTALFTLIVNIHLIRKSSGFLYSTMSVPVVRGNMQCDRLFVVYIAI